MKMKDLEGPRTSLGAVGERRKFSIALSDRSVHAFDHIKNKTDADTDTEVFRNAIRIHAMLLSAHEDGKQLYIQDGETKIVVSLTFFADVSESRAKASTPA